MRAQGTSKDHTRRGPTAAGTEVWEVVGVVECGSMEVYSDGRCGISTGCSGSCWKRSGAET